MELEDGEIEEFSPATNESSNLNNSDENREHENNELERKELEECSSGLDLETNLIRVLINSYGLSPVESSGDDKDGDLTDDFALELESQLEVTESTALNVIGDSEGFKGEEECDEGNESEDSLVIVLNDDFDLIQVDKDDSKIGIFEKEEGGESLGIEDGELNNDLGFGCSGESTLTQLNVVDDKDGDHSRYSIHKSARPVLVAGHGKAPVIPGVPSGQCVRPIAGIKLGRASTSSSVLPHHMRVFDINIDDLEEKKWRRSGVDISDFFNYGLDEEKWKDYCKQMEQLRLRSSTKSKLVTNGESRKENDQDSASKVAAKTVSRYPGHINLSGRTNARIQRSIGLKPSRFCSSGAIIEIVSQDSGDHETEELKEEFEPLDRGSRSRTIHKNIHGDRILPFPLDGYSQSTHHQERFRGEYSPRIRGDSEHKGWWEKEKNDKWRLKKAYEDNKRIITNSKSLNMIHQNTLNKRTSYKVSHEITKQRNQMRQRYYVSSNISEQDSMRGNWFKPGYNSTAFLNEDSVEDPVIKSTCPSQKRKWISS